MNIHAFAPPPPQTSTLAAEEKAQEPTIQSKFGSQPTRPCTRRASLCLTRKHGASCDLTPSAATQKHKYHGPAALGDGRSGVTKPETATPSR